MGKKLKSSKRYSKIINQIEKIRKNNNKNWMNVLRIAMNSSPKQTAKVMSEIYKSDSKIGNLVKKLTT